MDKEIFTIGHSTHEVDYFITLLKQNFINTVCDVRSHPYSKHNPQFNKNVLKDKLMKNGITYIFLGKELGARSENPNYYINGKVQYKYLANDSLFKQGIERLEQGMEKYKIALMCAEKDPITCHRMILVCRELRSYTKFIKHILSDGSIETNEEAEKRIINKFKIEPNLFMNNDDCIEEAYERQGQKIAYIDEKEHLITG
jgi:uncharacterized protein (DUF488 family)